METKISNAQEAMEHYLKFCKKEKRDNVVGVKTYSDYLSSRNNGLLVIPTGIEKIDEASGIGGLPRGKVIELFGTESGGKSYITLKAIASCQKQGNVAALLDVEQSFHPAWATYNGVDLNQLVYTNDSLSMETYLQLCLDFCKTGKFALIVIDSTAALISEEQNKKNVGETAPMAIKARIMSETLSKIVNAASETDTCVIFINQIREKPGVMWGSNETTPGGRALKFYSHMRIDVRRKGFEKITIGDDEVPIFQKSAGTFIKNKLSAPFGTFDFKIPFESVYTNPLVLLSQYAVLKKLFGKYKGEYKYKGDSEVKSVSTNSKDFLDLSRWIYSNGKVQNIITQLTTMSIEDGEDLPEFIEKIDSKTIPPPLKNEEVNSSEQDVDSAQEDKE